MKLPMLPQDKANHVIYGSVAGLAAVVLSAFIPILQSYLVFVPVMAGVLVGAGKEGLDYYMNKTSNLAKPAHSVDLMDLVYTAGGGGLISATLFVA